MKELKGSEKQIKWANDIRANTLNFVDELEKIKIERIKKEEITERCKRKFSRIREEILCIESTKFFIDNFRCILEHNSLEQKAFYINQKLKDSQFAEESRGWSFLEYETQVPHKLKKVKDNISYEEAKKIAREIKFDNAWANEIKENVLKIVKIFDEIIKQVPNASYIEETKELIIETLIQKDSQYFINGFKEIKEYKVENIREIEEISRKKELIWHLFYRGTNC